LANVSHASLTGSNLHEPKGISTATSGQVYVADGVGSGSWTSTSVIVPGMVADFATPVAPAGWLECDGSAVARTTYGALFTALTIQQSGSRGVGSAVITGLSSTANMRPGYFVGGTGITNGTTILTVDSATQITMSANAASSGTSTVIVSPFAQGDGSTTFTLPNTSTAGRYRRSRTSSLHLGVSQADTNKTHTHSVSGTTADDTGQAHTHSVSGTTGSNSVGHTHNVGVGAIDGKVNALSAGSASGNIWFNTSGSGPGVSSDESQTHTHSFSATSGNQSATHTHAFSATSGNNSDGGTESRPVTLIIMTCIKT